MRNRITRFDILFGALIAGSLGAACQGEKPPTKTQTSASAAPVASAEPPVTLPAVPPLPARPLGLPELENVKDNAVTAEKVDLGYRLFFEKRLSKDDSKSCGDCHLPDKGWATPNAVDAKVGGAMNKRNAPTMVNLGYHTKGWYWDGRAPTLEAVAAAAWKGQLGADPAAVATKLASDKKVKAYFQRAFGKDPSADTVPQALAAFLRELESGNSAFDKFDAGNKAAISAEAAHGWELFKTKSCTLCHVPPLFSDFDFHAAGIGSSKPDADKDHGRKDASKADDDDGKFKTPSLRNVALTAPYFHDGSAATLEQAIATMTAGGPKGAKVDAKLKPQRVSKKQAAAIKAFLESLTGETTFDKVADPL